MKSRCSCDSITLIEFVLARKKITFFLKKMQILGLFWTRTKEENHSLIKREESKRKEEEEREFGDFEMISSKRSFFLNFFPALFLFYKKNRGKFF